MTRLLIVLCVIMGACLYLQDIKINRLTAERDAAQADFRHAAEEVLRWKAVADARTGYLQTSDDALEACQQRERLAATDAQAVDEILAKAIATPRTPAHTQEVIDDATRTAVVDRLNRPL